MSDAAVPAACAPTTKRVPSGDQPSDVTRSNGKCTFCVEAPLTITAVVKPSRYASRPSAAQAGEATSPSAISCRSLPSGFAVHSEVGFVPMSIQAIRVGPQEDA